MLRAGFPWGDVGAQLANGHRAAELEAPGRLGAHWLPGRSAWACTSGVRMTRPTGGSPNRRRWRPGARSGRAARRRWPTGRGSLANGAAWKNSGRWPRRQPNLGGGTARRTPLAPSRWRWGHRSRRAADLEEALPLIERGVALSRTFGQPIQLAYALLGQAPVLRGLGEHNRAAGLIAEARSVLQSCPDPGILAERLSAVNRPPQMRRALSEDHELTEGELRVLKLLDGDLSERDIGRELYVAHSTVHSHVRAIYRKLAVGSRADALERGRELGLF